jgi:c-di-GMP-related signal transduction protein
MSIQLELWHFILLIIAFITSLFAITKLLLSQTLSSIEDKFTAQDAASDAFNQQLTKRLDRLEAASRDERDQWQRIERELLTLKADLPLNYVRREDYVQAVATIMAKLDAMSMRFENILLRGQTKHE